MAKMDERAKAELYKINQEKFFISVIIIAVFLIIKINLQIGILGMLGEITAAAVMFIYLIPYFVIRYKYKVIDEMVKKKLYRLSSAFFIAEMASMIPVVIITLAIVFNQLNGTKSMHLMDSSFPFVITLGIIVSIYGLIRMHNEKFASRRAAEMSLSEYKRRLLTKTIIATVIMVALLVAFIVLTNNYGTAADIDAASHLDIWLGTGVLLCFFGIPVCWFLYLYYINIRKKLAKKLQSSDESEKESLTKNRKYFYQRRMINGILYFIFFVLTAFINAKIQGENENIWIGLLVYLSAAIIYCGIMLTVYFIQKKIFRKSIDENANNKESQIKEGK